MKKSLCELLQDYWPRDSNVEDLYSTSIANCAFNSFLAYTAIMLNIVTMHGIRKTSSIPKTLKTLLLSLAVSDVSIGLLVQPYYTSLLIKWSQLIFPNCSTYKTFFFVSNLFCIASFFVAVSVDRFLAIHLHLRYQELVTHKRVVAVVISIWLLSAFLPFLTLSIPLNINNLIYINCCSCWSHYYSDGLHQDLFSHKTTQESDSGPASATRGTGSRRSKFCFPY